MDQADLQQLQQFQSSLPGLYGAQPRLALHADFSFESLGELGKGGMGVVYRVRDRRLDRDAALKMMQGSDSALNARFMREAHITASLDHPSIPPVYEVGETPSGQLYMLMRLIRGQTLREKLQEYSAETQLIEKRTELLGVVLKVAEAVGYGHSQGIVHRDLKPENIMVGEFGEVLVMDWGIAKDLNQEHEDPLLKSVVTESELQQAGLTVTGGVLGTPGYMSPEQLDGAEIDERADIFALGAVLFEVLTGSKAIRARTTVELLAATMSGQVERASHFDGSIGRDLDWIVARAMAPDLSERTETVKQFIEQLKAVLAGELVPGYRYSLLDRGLVLVRRAPGAFLSVTALMLLLTLLYSVIERAQAERLKARRAQIRQQMQLTTETVKTQAVEGQAAKAEAVLDSFNQARSFVRRGRSKEDIRELIERALKNAERNELALLRAGRIYWSAGLKDSARELLNEAVQRFPPGYEALYLLHKMEAGNNALKITEHLKRIVELSLERGDENELVLWSRALKCFQQNKAQEALELSQRIQEYSTSFAWGYLIQGASHSSLNQPKEAQRALETFLKLAPNTPLGYQILGLIHLGQGRRLEAVRYFGMTLELEPKNFGCLRSRALTLADLGQTRAALQDLNAAIKIRPDAVLYFKRGFLYQKTQAWALAIRDFSDAIAANRRFAEAYHNRGKCLARLAKYKEAVREYSLCLQIKPNFTDSYRSRGVLRMKLNDFKGAVSDMNEVLRREPGDENARLYRALSMTSLNQNEVALKDLSELSRSAKDPSVRQQARRFVKILLEGKDK